MSVQVGSDPSAGYPSSPLARATARAYAAKGLPPALEGFLLELRSRGGPVAFATMAAWATAEDTKARQSAKRAGFVVRTKDSQGRHAWLLTEEGQNALSTWNARQVAAEVPQSPEALSTP